MREPRPLWDRSVVAMRMEELTKAEPDSIVISQSVYDLAGDRIDVEPLAPGLSSGKNEHPQLYRVLRQHLGVRH